MIEQALMAGIPTVMIDRKGDLASYAAAATWSLPEADPERGARRRAARRDRRRAVHAGAVEGARSGSSLLPPGTEHLSSADREDEVAWATEAVAGMLGYKDVGGGRDRHCRAILQQALLLLAELPGGAGRGLEGLIQLLGEQDPELVGRVGKLDAKLFTRIAQDLDAHRLSTARLFDPASERLHIDDLLARQPGGRPRLSIVSTKFLGDNARVVFWLAQLLARITRWANQNPSSTLQALLLLDEADLYLPATTRPATKPVIENLLKRARSNGIGIMLATQSPGDLDYKCRDNLTSWFVGRVTQTTALAKMKPLLQDSPLDMDSALAKRKTGEFYLLRGGAPVDLRARRSAIDAQQLSEPEILAAAAADPRAVETFPRGASGRSWVVRTRPDPSHPPSAKLGEEIFCWAHPTRLSRPPRRAQRIMERGPLYGRVLVIITTGNDKIDLGALGHLRRHIQCEPAALAERLESLHGLIVAQSPSRARVSPHPPDGNAPTIRVPIEVDTDAAVWASPIGRLQVELELATLKPIVPGPQLHLGLAGLGGLGLAADLEAAVLQPLDDGGSEWAPPKRLSEISETAEVPEDLVGRPGVVGQGLYAARHVVAEHEKRVPARCFHERVCNGRRGYVLVGGEIFLLLAPGRPSEHGLSVREIRPEATKLFL